MFIPRKPEIGYTLVEILIASSMALLILGVVSNLLISSGRVSRKGMNKVYLQQRMNRLNIDLQRDLGLSSPQGVAVGETVPTPVSVHRRVVETSTISWEPKVIVYHASEEVLRRDEVELNPAPTSPFKPTSPGDWAPLLSTGNSSFVFNGTQEFEAVLEPNGLIRIKVTLTAGSEKLSNERLLRLRQGD